MRREYYCKFDGEPPERRKYKEKLIRDFLLNNCDTIRLKRIGWLSCSDISNIPGSGKEYGDDNDPRFIKAQKLIQPYFIKKTKWYPNARLKKATQDLLSLFPFVPYPPYDEYYYYNLSDVMKNYLNHDGLSFKGEAKYFYGFNPPYFFRRGKLIGSMIHSGIGIYLYLTDKESKYFEKFMKSLD